MTGRVRSGDQKQYAPRPHRRLSDQALWLASDLISSTCVDGTISHEEWMHATEARVKVFWNMDQ
jgi:hypothetical protein